MSTQRCLPSRIGTITSRMSRMPSQTIGANGSLSFTVPGVSMTNASDNGCQGATFTIPVTFTATS